MSVILKFLSILFFIPIFLILLILISLKFQVLNSNFWVNTFEKHNVYQNLENVAPKIIDYQIKQDEEVKIDKKITSSLLTKSNLKEFFEKNIKNTLNYANGESESWIIFIPQEKLPKDLLPNFLVGNNEIELDTLMSFMQRGEERGRPSFISQVPLTGRFLLIAIFIWAILIGVFLFVLYKLNVVPLTLFITGAVTLILIGIIRVIRFNMAKDLIQEGKEPAQMLLGTLAPPLLIEITNFWVFIAISLIIASFILGYLQKFKKLK